MDEVTDAGESSQNHSESEGETPYHPQRDDEESSAKEEDVTPKSGRLHPSTTAESQKSAARRGDPNHGCCLLTREKLAVQVCRLLPRAVKYSQLDKLEWVWGMKYYSLNVDTSRNLLFLTSDWHIFFDNDNWLLIPDADIVQKMYDSVEEDENRKTQPKDIQQLYDGKEVFEYHLVATEILKDKGLFRLQAPDEITATNVVPLNPPYTYHQYPFKSLGVLKSHVQPHFVLVNTGKKVYETKRPLVLARTAAEVLGSDSESVLLLLNKISAIYRTWTQIQVPTEFLRFVERSERRPPPKDERDSDEESPSEQRYRRSKRPRKSRGDGMKSLKGANAPPNVGYHTLLPVTNNLPCLEDAGMSIDSLTSPVEGQRSTYRDGSGSALESLQSWAEKCSQMAVNEGGWEASVFNDEQIGNYGAERARVPREESWRTWRAPWIRRNYNIHPPQTHKFSSNDWAVYHECSYLTD